MTGGAGFIASHVVDAYLAAGHAVAVVDNLSTGRRKNINPAAVFYPVDIRNGQALKEAFAAFRPEIVNHHAAQMDVRKSVEDPAFDATVNILGTINVLAQARHYAARRVIYASTGGAVYGEPLRVPVGEEHPIKPICPYGITKHTVEHYLYTWRALYGLDYVVLRYPNVYGPRQNPAGEAGVVAIFAGQMLAGHPVTIRGDGEQMRDYVHVSDIARANVAALGAPPGIYNLGAGRGVTVNQIFDYVRQATGYAQAPIYGPTKAGEIRAIYLDAAYAQRGMGWYPQVALEDGIQETVDYIRVNEKGQHVQALTE